MKQKTEIENFSQASISMAVLQNVIPAMAAMLMVLVYNLADTFFIGQTGDALQVAAVSLATPVFLMFMAVGTVFGVGGTSVISRAMGEGRKEYAAKVCAFCMWSCVSVGILMSVFMLIFMEPILSLIGASTDTWELTKTYLVIVTYSGPFVLISNCYSNVIRAEGRSKEAMLGQVIGNLLNIVLDPVMILLLGWEIAGAAIATAIGNAAGAIYYIWYFLRGNSVLSIRLRDVRLKGGICTGVLAIGIPAALGSALMSVSSIITNGQMAEYGDMAVAGIGVAMKITMVTGMLCIGLGQGVQPLLGFCIGARLFERFEKALRFSLLFALGLSGILTIICYLFTGQIVGAFLSGNEAFSYGVEFAHILLLTSFLFGIYYVLLNALQAMGAATESLLVNLSRQGLVFLPALFLLKGLLGRQGLVWAQPVADVVSLVLVLLLFLKSWKRQKGSA